MKISEKFCITDVDDVELRISRRCKLNERKIEGLASASPNKRQKHLIGAIADSHELWVVFDGAELPTFQSGENDVLHIWPNLEFAERFHSKMIANPRIVPIPIDGFIDDILFLPESDGRIVDLAYFPVGVDKQVTMSDRQMFLTLVSQEWLRRVYIPGKDKGF